MTIKKYYMAALSTIIFITALIALQGCNNQENISLDLEETSIQIQVGETYRLNATVSGNNSIAWESGNNAVATVDASGLVRGVAIGAATIEASCGGKTAVCEVTVTEATAESIVLSNEALSMVAGETFALEAEISPEHSAITWETSNPAIATVDGNGNITAINEGTAEISATSGETSATCLVTVAAAPQIGDFYYSDGTWSSELDGSKTPIAVVFYTGDPSVNDAAMQNEKPWCTHGLAVSLNLLENYGYAAWQTNYTEYGGEVGSWIKANTQYETTFIHPSEGNSSLLYHILGYNNTKGIEAFNYVPEHYDYLVDAVQYIADYREQCPAPAASSDWYLPSVIELLYIGTNDIPEDADLMNSTFPLNTIYTVNESIEKTGGLPVEISTRPYLTSVESVSGYMHVVLFASTTEKAGAFDSNKNVAVHNIRPVLAF